MFLDVGEDRCKRLCHFLIGCAYQTLAEAVAAIHSTFAGGENQGCLCIFMLQALCFGVARLAAGIPHACVIKLLQCRKAHFADWVIRIVWINQGKIIAGDGHRKIFDNGL